MSRQHKVTNPFGPHLAGFRTYLRRALLKAKREVLSLVGLDEKNLRSLEGTETREPIPSRTLLVCSPVEIVTVKAPRTGTPTAHVFAQRSVRILNDVTCDPLTGFTYTSAGYLVMEASPWPGLSALRIGSARLRGKPLDAHGPVSLAYGGNYYHWLIEALPALSEVRDACPDAKILTGPSPASFVSQSLNRLGIDPVQIGGPARFTTVAFRTFGDDVGWPHPKDVGWLREEFSAGVPSDGSSPALIYISRRSATRKPTNELQVEGELTALGFTVVHPENYSLMEQIALFRRARVIVAPHGAGLTNMLWAPGGCAVLELFSRDYVVPCFAALAQQCNHDYWPLVSMDSNPQKVDVARLVDVIRDLALDL